MQRTQGTPTRQNFNSDTGDFSFTFKLDTSIEAASVAFVNIKYWYPGSFTTRITSSGIHLPESAFTMSQVGNFISFTITDTSYDGRSIVFEVETIAL